MKQQELIINTYRFNLLLKISLFIILYRIYVFVKYYKYLKFHKIFCVGRLIQILM